MIPRLLVHTPVFCGRWHGCGNVWDRVAECFGPKEPKGKVRDNQAAEYHQETKKLQF